MADYDVEWQAALHLLRSPLLARKSTDQYLNPARRDIDWDRLLADAGAWSSGERLFAEVAYALWRGHGSDTIRAIGLLDEGNWQRFLQALQLRRGERPDLATHPEGWGS